MKKIMQTTVSLSKEEIHELIRVYVLNNTSVPDNAKVVVNTWYERVGCDYEDETPVLGGASVTFTVEEK